MTPRAVAWRAFWRQRTPRERVYLAVMAVSLALFAYVFLVLAPLRSMAAQAERRHASAQSENVRFAGVLAELAQRQTASTAPVDTAALLQSAVAAGIVVSPDASAAPGRVTLRFEAVPAQALFGWLSAVHGSQGLAPIKASLRRGPSGLDGELTFAVAGP